MYCEQNTNHLRQVYWLLETCGFLRESRTAHVICSHKVNAHYIQLAVTQRWRAVKCRCEVKTIGYSMGLVSHIRLSHHSEGFFLSQPIISLTQSLPAPALQQN